MNVIALRLEGNYDILKEGDKRRPVAVDGVEEGDKLPSDTPYISRIRWYTWCLPAIFVVS
jgi:hypothetical protein